MNEHFLDKQSPPNPAIFNISEVKKGILRNPKDEGAKTVFHTASSDRSALVELSMTITSQPNKMQQPVYFLGPDTQVDDNVRRLLEDERLMVQLAHVVATNRQVPELKPLRRQSSELRIQTANARASEVTFATSGRRWSHPVTYILIYVVDLREDFIVSGERPSKLTRMRRAAHSQLARGLPVRAAGELIFQDLPQEPFSLIEMTNGSGHYRPSTGTLQYALDMFNRMFPSAFKLPTGRTTKLLNAVAQGVPFGSNIL